MVHIKKICIIGKLKGWSSRKIDYIQVFPQASLDGEDIYMHIPRGFHVHEPSQQSTHVLQL